MPPLALLFLAGLGVAALASSSSPDATPRREPGPPVPPREALDDDGAPRRRGNRGLRAAGRGASIGAAAGSIVPGVGTVVGAVIGAGVGVGANAARKHLERE